MQTFCHIMFIVFITVVFMHGIILLGKFFVVKPLRNVYNAIYNDFLFKLGNITFLISSAIVVMGNIFGEKDNSFIFLGYMYVLLSLAFYLYVFIEKLLAVIVPKMKRFNADLERKRG